MSYESQINSGDIGWRTFRLVVCDALFCFGTRCKMGRLLDRSELKLVAESVGFWALRPVDRQSNLAKLAVERAAHS